MAHGQADWVREITPLTFTADKLQNGLDADKSASPGAGDVYYARDTRILYLCAVAGAWSGIDAASIVEGILTLYADLVGGGYEITDIADPTAAQSAATKAYADTKLANVVEDTTPQLGGELDAQSNKIVSLAAPTANNDAARKTEVDTVDAKLDDVSHSEPTRALDTVYQNTSGKVRLVTITVYLAAATNEGAALRIGSTSPPSTTASLLDHDADVAGAEYKSGTFIVPDDWYYEVVSSRGTPILKYWHEWDLH